MIETIGLTAAIHAADAACKAAGVRLTGYRKAGSGLVSVYFEGEISAMKVAVDSGVDAISGRAEFCMSLVMARPDTSVLAMLTQGCLSKVEEIPNITVDDNALSVTISEPVVAVQAILDQLAAESASEAAVMLASTVKDEAEQVVSTTLEKGDKSVAEEISEATSVTMVPNRKPAIARNKRGSISKSQGSKK
ncbi:BMC domain-containing protein [Photobacterium phosphoreum]|uniref:BMC domain-containing protein n=1 Tax=Photobacterium phosphoreum TaxID=659 RepID=UPI00242F7405|nr:BMC domain-containing protein [Photobacterium phosphoreum]